MKQAKNLMPKVFTSKTQKTGQLGEKIASKYLKNKNFLILDNNYSRKWGEIDIIALKDNITHFIEVKTVAVSYETVLKDVSREKNYYIKPEENMTFQKYKKLEKAVGSYVGEKGLEGEFQIDLLTVYLDESRKEAHIKVFEKISF